jgi:hypothetical protein
VNLYRTALKGILMADQKKQNSEVTRDNRESSSQQGAGHAGDPGRTPGTAEGDRRTVEEDLRNRGGDRQSS